MAATHGAALFTMIVRLADAFGRYVPPRERLAARAEAILQGGSTLLPPAAVGARVLVPA